MYKILFVTATKNEREIAKETLEINNISQKQEGRGRIKLSQGVYYIVNKQDNVCSNEENLEFSKISIEFFISGIGNYNTILSLTKKLSSQNYDFIVNIGVCGYKEKQISLAQIARIYNLANQKELLSPIPFIFCDNLESIASSEKIIYDEKDIFDENFVDQESYGIELVCNSFNIPRIILKVPFDKIGQETKNFDFSKAIKSLENIDYIKLVSQINDFLKTYKKEEIIANYNIAYHLTFSEKIILNKIFFGFKALSKNFEEFAKENKNLSKKDFINKAKKELTK